MTITEFLTARYDEREALFAVADFDAAASARGAGWGRRCCPLCDTYLWEGTEPATEAEFILHQEERHDREHVLADIAAKRAIVRHAQQAQEAVEARLAEPPGPVSGHVIAYRDVVRLLAQPYAEHPDFDPAWRAS